MHLMLGAGLSTLIKDRGRRTDDSAKSGPGRHRIAVPFVQLSGVLKQNRHQTVKNLQRSEAVVERAAGPDSTKLIFLPCKLAPVSCQAKSIGDPGNG